ncbi:MAG: leucyl aminopeptidase [Burkholderiales bacterium]|jgi:leucyl aminopeptidase|nr:leucyl aminopeptidase [Burkholderiales bacterium]
MKLKFGHNIIELTNNSNAQANVKIIFSFGANLLPQAKKHIGTFKIGKFEDLQATASITKLNDGQIILASLGELKSFDFPGLLKTLKVVAETIKNNSKITSISLVIEESLAKSLNQTVSEFTENSIFYLLNNLYYFDELKSEPKKLNLKLINIISASSQKTAIENALHMANGVFLIRDMAHGPSNIITPSHLAKTAKNLEHIGKNVKVHVLNAKDAKKLNMNTFLAVAKGADSEPKFIKMEYSGAAKNKKPIVLIGKGITFDSGGISLKAGLKMDAMKYDMCGAATVIGIFKTIANLELPLNLVCLVPTCENMPSGHALKPGDVIKTMSGKTVEIANTDAEGRLILCDALHYAKKYKPELVIDIATLTGACITALGSAASGLYSNDDILAAALTKSGLNTNDKVWRMPLFKEYHDMLKGTVADLSNIGSWSGEAGSATAACFLEQFTDYKWAHLDVAGTAMSGTGRPFYMLMNFLRNIK